MCLAFGGIKGDGSYPQLEDQLYQRCLNRGWSRHDPQGLKLLAESYGFTDDLTTRGTIEDIKQAIDEGKPCVLHGYFTRFGHIVAVKGYDTKGLIVNDPWGEMMFDFSNPEARWYNNKVSGEGLCYSYRMIAMLCSPESVGKPRDIWLHRIYKR